MSTADRPAFTALDQALLDPASVFTSPEQVLDHAGLSRDQKEDILRRWDYDAREIAVAEEEGMLGADDDLLRRIELALQKLRSGADVAHAGPTKQHGIP